MPKVVDHDQYRRELLSKCFELFAEKGYAALTMRQIAQGLTVSTGTLYHYFPSKEVLFEQLIEELEQQTMHQAIAELSQAQTLTERVQLAFEFIARNEDAFIKQTLLLIEFYQQKGREQASQNQVLKRVWDRQMQAIAQVMDIPDERLFMMLGCLIDGILLHRFFGLTPISYTAQSELMTELLTTYYPPSETP